MKLRAQIQPPQRDPYSEQYHAEQDGRFECIGEQIVNARAATFRNAAHNASVDDRNQFVDNQCADDD